MKRRILEVAGSNFGRGGLSTMAYNWAMMLPEDAFTIDFFSVKPFEKSGFTENIIGRGGSLFSADIPRGQSVNPFASYKALADCLSKNQYDVVHVHCNCSYKAIVHAKCAKDAGVRNIIVHSHAAGMESTGMAKRALNAACRSILPRYANEYFSCSDLASQWMFPKRVLGKVKIVGNDVDIQRFASNSEMRTRQRETFGFTNDDLVIGFMGRLTAVKNPLGLIQIFAAIAQNIPSARFLMVGDGDMEAEVNEAIKSASIENKVVRVRHTDQPQDCFAAMDLFCLPSASEGNPLVVAEAQASGLSCMVSTAVSKDCDPLGTVRFIDKNKLEQWVNCARELSESLNERDKRVTAYADYAKATQCSAEVLSRAYQIDFNEEN